MKSLKTASLYLFILFAVSLSPQIATAQSVVTFSSLKFTRMAGPTNVFTQNVTVPASLVGPFTLSVVNGESSSDNNNGVSISGAVSSGSVLIDGIEVVIPRDFSKVVREITKPLNLSPGNHNVEVKLDGQPNSFITLTFFGVQAAPPPTTNPFPGK